MKKLKLQHPILTIKNNLKAENKFVTNSLTTSNQEMRADLKIGDNEIPFSTLSATLHSFRHRSDNILTPILQVTSCSWELNCQ